MKSHIDHFFLGALVCLIVLSLSTGIAAAQSKASCTFTLFTLPNSVASGDFALGINSYSTVVGQLEDVNTKQNEGFIRYVGGDVNFFNAAPDTWFTARNDLGNSIGVESSPPTIVGFMLHGTSGVTRIVDPKAVNGTFPQGINKWNSVVGYYLDGNKVAHGFKMFSNGSFMDINYPNAQSTTPLAINDSGTIVGAYSDQYGIHGFIYGAGKWALVEYPGVQPGTTTLSGISDSNTIIGFTTGTGLQGTSFLYKNGVFKVIADPKAAGGTYANGIAPNGLITGDVYLTTSHSSQHGFIAKCQ